MARKNAKERLEQRKTREKRFFIALWIVVILGVVGFSIYNILDDDDGDNDVYYNTNDISGDDVEIKRSDLADGKFHHYDTTIDGVRLKYFAVLDDDGKIRTAFDACEVCHESRKGYTQVGDYAKCNNCGQRFSVSGLGTKNADGGGCWPGHLPHQVEGDNIIINRADLEKGSYLFS